ncbi:hypothetical protein V3C99_018687 [Haemonchus contortus]|uniref:Transposase n=1 Tax=Haemonchus contortus TaxID=6289 RepID=A0A7I5EDT7_HAECO
MCVQTIWKRHKVTGVAEVKSHLEAARLTLCLVDGEIVQCATNGSGRKFSRNLDAREFNPSVNTVLRLLKEVGLFGRRPAKKPLMSDGSQSAFRLGSCSQKLGSPAAK